MVFDLDADQLAINFIGRSSVLVGLAEDLGIAVAQGQAYLLRSFLFLRFTI